MMPIGFTLFDTAIGTCGIAWSDKGVTALQLPEGDTARTRARLVRRRPGAVESAPSPSAAKAIAGATALLAGEARDLTGIPVDLDGVAEFDERVYTAARKIPPGRTLTYGAIAEELGDRLLAREVGAALGRNPVPLIIPCHRVLAAGNRPGGFSAPGGTATKLRLLRIEGAWPEEEPGLFDRAG
jgi:methylated-DNA-[protein]-cysteine S-methyltransferase